ncbi:MAG: hypothetical protein K0U15_05995, partial [Proteobacteria bacterium]|nr:hypothetical protein [Pseudomonadota bacterium]
SPVGFESTNILTVEAVDNHSTPVTASIVITLSSQHPQDEVIEIALPGGAYLAEDVNNSSNTLIVTANINHLYTGIIVSIRNSNPGKYSGISATGAYSVEIAHGTDYALLPVSGAAQNREMQLRLTTPKAAGGELFVLRLTDEHSGNAASKLIAGTVRIVNSLSISPAGANSEINNSNIPVATVALAANTGLAPYTYRVSKVNSANSQLDGAFSAFSMASSGDTNGTLNFAAVSGVSSTVVVTVIVQATDSIGDTADFDATITIYPSISIVETKSVVIHRSYIAASFYTPSDNISGGKPPYTYAIDAVQSSNSALDANSFYINSASGALVLNTAVAIGGITATIVVGVSDSLLGSNTYSVIVGLTDNGLAFANSTATIRSSDDSSTISNHSATWQGANAGAIRYRLGTTDPAAATANFTVNSNNGELALINSLGSAQIVSAQIIAHSEDILGVFATATVVIEALTPIAFASANNPQAAVIATTYALQNNLFIVNADFAGNISYSVSDNRFSNSDNVINLISAINTTGEIVLTIVASETILGDTATLTATVNFVDPPALTFSASNIQNNVFVTSTAKIADLAISGGFLQGDYSVYLLPANDANFAVDYTVGDNTAVLNLTNNAITGASLLTATVVLNDEHPTTAPKTLAFTVAIKSGFSFGNGVSVSAAYRTELDNNIDLLTLNVLGASGNVTYGFVGTQPTQYVLSPVSGDDTQIVVSLQAIVNAEVTSTLTIRAVDNNAATVSITVEISSEHPETETSEIALVGREYGAPGPLYVHHLYGGVIASIRVTNTGKFSGLRNSSSSYSGTGTGGGNPYRFRQKAGSKDLEVYLNSALNRAPANFQAENYSYNYQINDNHSGNGKINKSLAINYVHKLALNSAGISAAINSKVGGTFATLQIGALSGNGITTYHGRSPYVYTITDVTTDSSLSTQLSAALTIELSDSNRTAELSINPVPELTENALVTATIRVVDGLNVTVFYVATLNILVPLAPPALETVTVQRTYTANDFHTPPPNGGIAPHTYVINAVQSDNSAL